MYWRLLQMVISIQLFHKNVTALHILKNKKKVCDEAKSLFKTSDVLEQKKDIHKIPIDYLPRDKINEEHINRVFSDIKYKPQEINKHMQNI